MFFIAKKVHSHGKQMVILEKEKIEYEQANELLRHYHTLQWISGTVFISTAFAIIGLTWEVRELLALCLFATLSFSLYTIWAIIQGRYQDYVKIILDRIWKLERLMCLDLHLQIKRQDEVELQRNPIRHSLKKVRNLIRYVMPSFLVLLWVLKAILTWIS